MLEDPVAPTVIGLAWPNMLMMLAQSSTGFVEAWFISRLGTDSLAGTALVLPLIMLMQNMSQGAIGGGISSAIARSLGAGRQADADRIAFHALLIAITLGAVFSSIVLMAGPQLYTLLGGRLDSLDAALVYSNVVFGGITLMWTMNALASVIRGTGNMVVPGSVICAGALLLVPLSPSLIFGVGQIPGFGIAGAGYALLSYYGGGTLVLAWYCISGRNPTRLSWTAPSWKYCREILAVGGLATINSLQTNVMLALCTALIAAYIGTSAVAGYGTAARLEYLIAPLAFGIGAPLVALVSANIAAKQPQRALRITIFGGILAFVVAEAIGLAVAIRPTAWLRLFSTDPTLLEAGSTYLRLVGPFYGFFGMGWALYFASQGAGRLKWPLVSGFLRLMLSVGIGWGVLHFTASLPLFFITYATAMLLYGGIIAIAAFSGVWFPHSRGA